VTAVGGDQLKGAAYERRERNGLDRAADLLVDEQLHVFVVDDIRQPDEQVRGLAGDPLGVGAIGEPRRGPLRDASAADALGDDHRAEEVLLDELAEGAAELVLALAYDGGVGDGEAERVAEQRGDCEPVGQAADE
jgi:hypothetical protein